MSLGVNEEAHFHSLARALGRADWLTDPRFAERSARKSHAADLALEIEVALADKTAKVWEPILQSAGVPCARLRGLPEALASEQAKLRGFVQKTEDGTEVPTLPFRLGKVSTYAPTGPAPELGADTDTIRSWLARESQ